MVDCNRDVKYNIDTTKAQGDVVYGLGCKYKKRREELKLSQEYVAEQLGVSRQAVSKWETGQSEPTASNLIQLAAVFEMNLSELVAPNKNHKEQSSFEKEPTSTKPNLILRANL